MQRVCFGGNRPECTFGTLLASMCRCQQMLQQLLSSDASSWSQHLCWGCRQRSPLARQVGCWCMYVCIYIIIYGAVSVLTENHCLRGQSTQEAKGRPGRHRQTLTVAQAQSAAGQISEITNKSEARYLSFSPH